MKNYLKMLISIFFTILLIACGNESEQESKQIIAYYGDRTLQRTVIIDVNNMELVKDIVTEGEGQYSVNQAGNLPKVYVDTRKSNYVEVIDTKTNTFKHIINLPHKVRSSDAYNPTLKIQLVAGSDKPMTSLIDIKTDTVIASVGENQVFPVNGDYGGSNASGHPFWLTNNKFVVIDRPNRKIHVYQVNKNNIFGKYDVVHLSVIDTITTVHHIIHGRKNNIYYALAEGSQERMIAPSLIKYKLEGNNLIKMDQLFISKTNIAHLGGHHIDLAPNGKVIYFGSTEGNMFVIKLDNEKLKLMKIIPVGKGAGHTTFIKERHMAIITNHKDTFLSIIDTNTHTLIKNVTVSGPQKNNAILQSHTSFVHPNGKYFYSFATDNGIFYELDLDTLKVTRTLETGGTPLQGVFVN